MHRELKRDTACPAAATLRAQQRRFDAFCQLSLAKTEWGDRGRVPLLKDSDGSPKVGHVHIVTSCV